MEFELLGWPADGPTLELDHERFAYAGKFGTARTGKAIAREHPTTPESATTPNPTPSDDEIVGAISFNEDRGTESALRIRYVTVREDRRGERIGPRLAQFVRVRAGERGYDRVRIAVNNPVAYEALYRAGFTYTGDRTGMAELVLEAPAADAGGDGSTPDRTDAYRSGLDVFADRDLPEPQRRIVDRGRDRGPPDTIANSF